MAFGKHSRALLNASRAGGDLEKAKWAIENAVGINAKGDSYYGYQKWEGYMPLYNAPLWGSEAHQIFWFHEAFGGLCWVCCCIIQMWLFFTHVQRIHFLWVLQNAHFSRSNIKNIWSTSHKSTCTLLGSFVRQIQQDKCHCGALLLTKVMVWWTILC